MKNCYFTQKKAPRLHVGPRYDALFSPTRGLTPSAIQSVQSERSATHGLVFEGIAPTAKPLVDAGPRETPASLAAVNFAVWRRPTVLPAHGFGLPSLRDGLDMAFHNSPGKPVHEDELLSGE